MNIETLTPSASWQTPARGDLCDEYDIYLTCANDGKGGDITNNGAPLKSLQEWMES